MVAPLHRADGSATYSANGYTVIASVNGPIEVQRRDELAEEAAVEVHVRPASGVGGTKERYLESILHSTFTRIILTHQFPRTLIQLTLQILSIPDVSALPPSDAKTNPSSILTLLPSLLQTSLNALLSASIPLDTIYTSTLVTSKNSQHVFAFTGTGEMLVAESEGEFGIEEWDTIAKEAEETCLNSKDALKAEADIGAYAT
ncbi:hypothetical protein E2P81_ATG06014 [Venturia nashicola]|uniref:Exoribonuclease phosphorolytic domain-containing protein n=1 Tax=Venturia nashicola TaxID=86259 RepID=A0A4Z1NTF2_9PEZI|nr:hypothetical protein E6O75_ATG06157 [Venturia nashicola]TLD29720.1 hypothetical protein E2P81_ATG06014 [Venturia nashicola]